MIVITRGKQSAFKLIVLTAKKSVLSDKNLLFARLTEVH